MGVLPRSVHLPAGLGPAQPGSLRLRVRAWLTRAAACCSAVLNPKTRLYFSLGLMACAAIGLYLGDTLVPESDEEKQAREAKEGARAISVSS